MHTNRIALLFFATLFSGNLVQGQEAAANRASDSPWEFSVSQADGKAVRLGNQVVGNRLTILLFLGADCPLSQKALTEAAEDLAKIGAAEKVGLLGLLVARDDAQDIDRLRQVFRANFPIYMDRDNLVARKLGVSVVPTAVLLDQAGRVLYQGRINDRVEQLGKRSNLKRRDLGEALADALSGNPVRVARTEAVGCPVETRKAQPEAQGEVEYYRDIQPILYRNCVSCHQRDGAAPFSLEDYEDATLWLELGTELIKRKQMPPGQAESDFEFANPAPKPTRHDMEVIGKWLQAGMPRGKSPAKAPEAPATDPDVAAMGKPDLVLKMGGPMTIGPVGDDLYRYFNFKLNLDRDLKVRALRLAPGNRKVVHHALIFTVDDGILGQVDSNQILHDADLHPGDKGPGFGFSEMLAKYFVPKKGETARKTEFIGGYVPGEPLNKAPAGFAITIPKHSNVVVQMHYHRTGKEEIDNSTIELYLADKDEHPEKAYKSTNINDGGFLVMPPNQRRRTRFDWPVEEDCEVVKVAPHGHNLTLSQTFTLVTPDGQARVLLDVPAFDFNWQKGYTFKRPIPVSKGSFIRVSSLMDNTASNPRNPNKPPRPVFLGENTKDEMVYPLVALILPRNSRWNLDQGFHSLRVTIHKVSFLRYGLGLDNAGVPAP